MQLLYVTPQEILDFWFDKDTRRHWFTESQYLDLKIRTTYERVFRNAVNCELSDWRDTIQGRLAEIIILDQFSRAILSRQTPCLHARPHGLAAGAGSGAPPVLSVYGSAAAAVYPDAFYAQRKPQHPYHGDGFVPAFRHVQSGALGGKAQIGYRPLRPLSAPKRDIEAAEYAGRNGVFEGVSQRFRA